MFAVPPLVFVFVFVCEGRRGVGVPDMRISSSLLLSAIGTALSVVPLSFDIDRWFSSLAITFSRANSVMRNSFVSGCSSMRAASSSDDWPSRSLTVSTVSGSAKCLSRKS